MPVRFPMDFVILTHLSIRIFDPGLEFDFEMYAHFSISM